MQSTLTVPNTDRDELGSDALRIAADKQRATLAEWDSTLRKGLPVLCTRGVDRSENLPNMIGSVEQDIKQTEAIRKVLLLADPNTPMDEILSEFDRERVAEAIKTNHKQLIDEGWNPHEIDKLAKAYS